ICYIITAILILLNTAKAQQLRLVLPIGHTDEINTANFSADGKRIVTCSGDHTAKLWDADQGFLLADLTGHRGYVFDAVFSPDGNRIATVANDSTSKVWDARTGQLLATLKGHKLWLRTASFSADSKRLVTTADDKMALIYSMDNFELLTALKSDVFIDRAIFSADGKRMFITSRDALLREWDIATGILLRQTPKLVDGISIADISLNGERILAVQDSIITIYNLQTLEKKAEYHNTKDIITAAISGDGTRVSFVTRRDTAKIWDIANNKILLKIPSMYEYETSMAYLSPKADKLLLISRDGEHRVVDTRSKKILYFLKGHTKGWSELAFLPNTGNILHVAQNGVKIWDTQKGGFLLNSYKHKKLIESTAIAPDGGVFVTTSRDTTAVIWNSGTGAI
ncbi:MAG: WD40 repeat domain-containing protein, partial [Sphingobacteriales bacterium]